MRISSLVALIIFSGISSCKTRTPSSDGKMDTSAIRGFIAPGKGFNLAANDVTGAVCVVGDKIADPDSSTSSTSSEPSTEPTSPTTSPSPASPSVPSTTDNAPATTPKIDPETGGIKLTNNSGSDLGDVAIEFAAQSSRTGLSLGNQGGGTSVQFYYLTSTRDVSAAIEASYSNNSSASGGKGKVKGEISSSFEAQLNAKYQNTTENVYVLMHGRKEFPARNSDAIINASFNTKLRNLVFSGSTIPTEKDLADSWRRMMQTCGDHYVEYTINGREIWMVAVMNKKTFEAAMGGAVNYGAKASGSFGSTATASKEIKAGVKTDGGVKLMGQTVDVLMMTRGKNQVEGGKFNLTEALEQMNKFLTSETSDGEAVLRIGIKNYDSVAFQFEGTTEKRGGDIFTRTVRDTAGLNTDIFVKVQSEENWANREADRIWNNYGWEQWSLDPRFHNGIAAQYVGLRKYQKLMSDVFAYCGSRNLDVNTVPKECIDEAKKAVSSPRPQLNLPQRLSHKIHLWMSGLTIQASENQTFDYWNYGTAYGEAHKSCAASGWTVPNEDDWKRVLDASYFYTKWQKQQNPGYRPADDKSHLAYPCSRFGNKATFWSTSPSMVVQMNHMCESGQVQDIKIPSDQRFRSYIFWTKELAFHACVKYDPFE